MSATLQTIPETTQKAGDISTEHNAFPLHCLPPKVQEIVKAMAERNNVPAGLPACCALGFVSGAVGKGLKMQTPPDGLTNANLFILGTAPSGVGKSTILEELAKPFREYEQKLLDQHKPTGQQIRAQRKVLNAQVSGVETTIRSLTRQGNSEEKISKLSADLVEYERCLDGLAGENPKRLVCEDITAEKLAVLLADNGETIMSVSAEAGAAINTMLGQYKKGASTDVIIYLKGYSGDSLNVDRVGRSSVMLKRPCLSLLWLTQPAKLEKMLRHEELIEGGFLPRMLLCQVTADFHSQKGPAVDPGSISSWRSLIQSVLTAFRFAEDPLIVKTASSADVLFQSFRESVADRGNGDCRDVRDFAMRWVESALKLALVLHVGEHGAQSAQHDLVKSTAANAIEIMEWFIHEQLSLLGADREQQKAKLYQGVLDLCDRKEEVQASDLYYGKLIVPNAQEAHLLLIQMKADRLLTSRDILVPGGGHPTKMYKKILGATVC